ncbi:unnamed protein product [Arabidopsis thaliana]|uniref:Transcription repressor n=1 Tax=Arabidopsis thaliana TaxID=3702 RepID=A0A7G2EE35_ARATH|nr:unnamed protein product [Arabidopsis thaliana]
MTTGKSKKKKMVLKAVSVVDIGCGNYSDDPYLDFRQSMLQMILENEIYSKNDLRELLHCFLSLNEPYHHGIIIRAFSEIWDGVFSAAKRRGDVQESPLVHRHGSRASHRNHYHRSK